MGKGKADVDYWAARVKPGTILYEISGVPEESREAGVGPHRPQDAGALPVRGETTVGWIRPRATARER